MINEILNKKESSFVHCKVKRHFFFLKTINLGVNYKWLIQYFASIVNIQTFRYKKCDKFIFASTGSELNTDISRPTLEFQKSTPSKRGHSYRSNVSYAQHILKTKIRFGLCMLTSTIIACGYSRFTSGSSDRAPRCEAAVSAG